MSFALRAVAATVATRLGLLCVWCIVLELREDYFSDCSNVKAADDPARLGASRNHAG